MNLLNKNTLLFSAVLAFTTGIFLVGAGSFGIIFTYKNIVQEKIVTPADANIPNKLVRGPFTLYAQAKIIRKHTLSTTGGKTFAEMPREIPKLDGNGIAMMDEKGNPILELNKARDIWITATTLITALNLGILTYLFSGIILLIGLISIWTSLIFIQIHSGRKI